MRPESGPRFVSFVLDLFQRDIMWSIRILRIQEVLVWDCVMKFSKKKKNQYSRQSINGPSQALSMESRDIKEAFLWELAPLARCRRGIGLCLRFNWVLMSYKWYAHAHMHTRAGERTHVRRCMQVLYQDS